MYRLAVIFTSLLLVAAWSAPVDAAADQRRARRRDPGTTQAQPAPQRAAPARRAPAPQNDGAARRAAPRRTPGRDTAQPPGDTQNQPRTRGSGAATANGDRRQPGRAHVGAPSAGGTNVASRTGRAGDARQGTARVNRRPPRGPVVGTAVARPPGSSGPTRINGRRGRGGVRGGVRGYTPYRGRHRAGVPRIYGNRFYFPGYSTFSVGVGYGSGYLYDPYWYGYSGYGYGYSPYTYGGYRRHYDTGSLRVKVRPQVADVIVDGYYVGVVNDYDGIFQRLRLEEGPHHVEIAEPGFETLAFDVLILPGETITYEGHLVPLP